MKGTKVTDIFMNVNHNTTPVASITWHQKESLCCVLYSDCPTNDSTTNVYIAPVVAAAYLAIMLPGFLAYCRG